MSAYPAFVKGGFCIAGFARTRSVPSLVAGVGCVFLSLLSLRHSVFPRTPSCPPLPAPPRTYFSVAE
ncbi:hypothetical protein C8R43DRAFT_1009024 [Mycena crocata]|nr:hypothetical protein C8R43DRAFT_1009024 [Mycena crocata]